MPSNRKSKYAPKAPRPYKPGWPSGRGRPDTSDRIYDEDEIEFMKAMERYKRETGTLFPTCSDVLAVLRSLGYRRVAEPTELPGRRPR